MILKNKHVLALPSGEYDDILKKVYIEGSTVLGWKIFALAASPSLKPYQDFIDSPAQLIPTPPLNEKMRLALDPKTIADTEHFMSVCEKMVGVPINRILLSAERNIGRAYSKHHYYWAEKKIAKMALKDNTLASATLVPFFIYAKKIITEYKIELCLGAPTSGLINTVFYFVCRYYRVPYIACNTSVVGAGRHFWTSDWGSFNMRIAQKYAEFLQKNHNPTLASQTIITDFRNKPTPLPHYQSMWLDKNNQLSFVNIHKQIFKRILHRIIPIIKRQPVLNPKPVMAFIIDTYRTYFLQHRQKKYYRTFSTQTLKGLKYIYYPFHLDPEIVLNVMAPTWHNQLNTIKMLSYNLPVGYHLLVREHRYNIGRRPTRYLKEISRLPGVILIDGYDNQYKYLQNANLVVTVNGTSGFEGILLQRPVLTLDKTFYDKLQLAKPASQYADLGQAILDAIHHFKVTDNDDRKIATFFDAENEVTLTKTAEATQEIAAIAMAIEMDPAMQLSDAAQVL